MTTDICSRFTYHLDHAYGGARIFWTLLLYLRGCGMTSDFYEVISHMTAPFPHMLALPPF